MSCRPVVFHCLLAITHCSCRPLPDEILFAVQPVAVLPWSKCSHLDAPDHKTKALKLRGIAKVACRSRGAQYAGQEESREGR